MTSALLERGTISEGDLQLYWGGGKESVSESPSFVIGQSIRVVDEDKRVRWRKPHLRIPGYIHGCKGVIDAYLGCFRDPYLLAFRSGGDHSVHPKMHLYRVLFFINDIEKSRYYGEKTNKNDIHTSDSVSVDIFETWLESSPTDSDTSSTFEEVVGFSKDECEKHDHNHAHENDHNDHHHDHHHGHHHDHHSSHDHGHEHEDRLVVEQNAINLEGVDTPGKQVGEALLSILLSKGLVTLEALRSIVETLENNGLKLSGASIVAKAWVDPEFKKRYDHMN
jgi:hypothetical protein